MMKPGALSPCGLERTSGSRGLATPQALDPAWGWEADILESVCAEGLLGPLVSLSLIFQPVFRLSFHIALRTLCGMIRAASFSK